MTDLLLILGAAAIIAGAFLYTVPAGLVAAGVCLCVAAIVLERAGVRVGVRGDDA